MKKKYIIYNILSVLSYIIIYVFFSKLIYHVLDLFNIKEDFGVLIYELTHLFICLLCLFIILKKVFGYYSKSITFRSSLPNCNKQSSTNITIFKKPIFITTTIQISQLVVDEFTFKIDNHKKRIIITHLKLLKLINWKKIKNLTQDDFKILLYKLGVDDIIKNITIDNNLNSKVRKEKIKNIL